VLRPVTGFPLLRRGSACFTMQIASWPVYTRCPAAQEAGELQRHSAHTFLVVTVSAYKGTTWVSGCSSRGVHAPCMTLASHLLVSLVAPGTEVQGALRSRARRAFAASLTQGALRFLPKGLLVLQPHQCHWPRWHCCPLSLLSMD
jgi:hypothetical protein